LPAVRQALFSSFIEQFKLNHYPPNHGSAGDGALVANEQRE
jgi:hypothetical protein